jgi:hypothetical protein
VAAPGTENINVCYTIKKMLIVILKNATANQADSHFLILMLGHRIKNVVGGKYRLLFN